MCIRNHSVGNRKLLSFSFILRTDEQTGNSVHPHPWRVRGENSGLLWECNTWFPGPATTVRIQRFGKQHWLQPVVPLQQLPAAQNACTVRMWVRAPRRVLSVAAGPLAAATPRKASSASLASLQVSCQ